MVSRRTERKDQNPSAMSDGSRVSYVQIEQSTSPIGYLSQELLTLILDLLHNSFDDDPSNLDASRSRAQDYITASHVSRFWRFVALENPLWWSKISIRPPWKIEVVDAYLKRSKECQLELKFSCYDPSRYYSPIVGSSQADNQQLLELLVPHFHRCRILQLHGLFREENALPFSSLQLLLSADMPFLEEFFLQDSLSHYEEELSASGSRRLFSFAVIPRTVGLAAVDFGMFYKAPRLLTTLHLCQDPNTFRLSFGDFKIVLESCHSLITLALYDNLLDRSGHGTAEVSTLENLYILGGDMLVSNLLLFLKTPKLKNLAIVPISSSDLQELMIKGPAVHNCHFPSLKTLTLAPVYCEDLQGIGLASRCFPFIERLNLINVDTFSGVDLLRITDARKITFPNLKELGLVDLQRMRVIMTIRDMARNRAKQNSPLRKIYLDAEAFESYCDALDAMDEDRDEQVPCSVVEGDLWEPQRRKLLFSEVKHIYL